MRLLVLLTALSVSATGLVAQQPHVWNPQTIKWQDIAADGTKYALLEGRRDVPGEAFTYAFFIPAGYWEHHWHSSDARVAVVKGALRLGYGDKLDRRNSARLAAGSFALVPANRQHTMGADEDTIIIGTAIGPWATHRHAEDHAKHGPAHPTKP
jgi:quercetin dioxygenase-like cupin family protein